MFLFFESNCSLRKFWRRRKAQGFRTVGLTLTAIPLDNLRDGTARGYEKLEDFKLTRDLAFKWQALAALGSFVVAFLLQLFSDFSLEFWHVKEINISWYVIVLATLLTVITHELVHGIGVSWLEGSRNMVQVWLFG